MNNNRGNNRRRGRGNRQNNSGGGGQQLNRIDSRARGNAPQMLEKYRKLAHDAHLNGDRVQAEYYLQFADHYFRVIADQRQRQEEQRVSRQDRFQEGGDEGGDEGEFTGGSDFPSFDQPVYNRREDRAPREDRGPREDRAPREDRTPREDRSQREDREPRSEDGAADASEAAGAEPSSDASVYEPAENPFLRENRENRESRGNRGLRPRRDDRRPRRDRDEGDAPAGLDASILPPAIGVAREEPAPVAEAAEEAPAPRRRTRKPKAETPTEEAAE